MFAKAVWTTSDIRTLGTRGRARTPTNVRRRCRRGRGPARAGSSEARGLADPVVGTGISTSRMRTPGRLNSPPVSRNRGEAKAAKLSLRRVLSRLRCTYAELNAAVEVIDIAVGRIAILRESWGFGRIPSHHIYPVARMTTNTPASAIRSARFQRLRFGFSARSIIGTVRSIQSVGAGRGVKERVADPFARLADAILGSRLLHRHARLVGPQATSGISD